MPRFFLFSQSNSNMSHEILSVLEYMEKEKGIADAMIQAIASAIASAAQKSINTTNEIRVEINPKSEL